MKTRLTILLLVSLLISPAAHGQSNPMKTAIIKADDVRGPTANWIRFFALSRERGVKVSAGVICNSLPSADAAYQNWLRDLQGSGWVEFWNHGWDHLRWKDAKGATVSEFSGTGRAHQQTHFNNCQSALQNVLGSAPVAFGSPYNAADADTTRVMNADAEMRLFFGYKASGLAEGKYFAPIILRGEHAGTGQPDFERFKADYLQKPDTRFTAIQFHPDAFAERHFEQYAQILTFLLAQGWQFVLPAEYVAAQDAGHPPSSQAGPVAK